jgi:hypothetical protein
MICCTWPPVVEPGAQTNGWQARKTIVSAANSIVPVRRPKKQKRRQQQTAPPNAAPVLTVEGVAGATVFVNTPPTIPRTASETAI